MKKTRGLQGEIVVVGGVVVETVAVVLDRKSVV